MHIRSSSLHNNEVPAFALSERDLALAKSNGQGVAFSESSRILRNASGQVASEALLISEHVASEFIRALRGSQTWLEHVSSPETLIRTKAKIEEIFGFTKETDRLTEEIQNCLISIKSPFPYGKWLYHEELMNSTGLMSYLKAHKKRPALTLRHSYIRSFNGHLFRLMNTLDEQDAAMVSASPTDMPVKPGKLVLNAGPFGRCRLAYSYELCLPVEVKKIRSFEFAHCEAEMGLALSEDYDKEYGFRDDENVGILVPFDFAVRPAGSSASLDTVSGETKTYLFRTLLNGGTGEKMAKKLSTLGPMVPFSKGGRYLKTIATQYCWIVSRVHSLGYSHRNIDLRSMMHDVQRETDSKGHSTSVVRSFLADFTTTQSVSADTRRNLARVGHLPPEYWDWDTEYSGLAHDNFSLAVILIQLCTGGDRPEEGQTFALDVMNTQGKVSEFKVKFSRSSEPSNRNIHPICNGVHSAWKKEIDTPTQHSLLTYVIVGMLDISIDTRMTSKESSDLLRNCKTHQRFFPRRLV